MKVLVISYSYTGTCRRLSAAMCAEMGWESGEVREERSRSGATGLLRCLVDSLFRRRPAVTYVGSPPEGFDAVVLAAPIWAHRLAAPMRSFVANNAGRLTRFAVVAVMGGQGAGNALAEIDELVGRPPDLCTSFTARQVDEGSFAGRIRSFAEALEDSGTPAPLRPAVWSTEAV